MSQNKVVMKSSYSFDTMYWEGPKWIEKKEGSMYRGIPDGKGGYWYTGVEIPEGKKCGIIKRVAVNKPDT
jgi:hypothetical protein